ncbi:helix-turn-helix transcriptional regulator [Thermopolyspora sp. NPDC052614]|uniref:helix-turn-helix domain-containing protein n=1 Tax=Thermopolyspora sp. NPDC052614 TaxID=3155682 RepID=UPI0034482054
MYDEVTIGARLRILRRWRRMSLEQLAGLAGLSPSFLSMAERGQRALDRRSHIAALAAALKVSETELVGGPHLSADPVQSQPHANITALRLALTSAELGESAVDRARPVAELAATLAGPIEQAWRRNDYVTEGRLLPSVMDELHYHVANPADEHTHRLALETLVEAAVHASGLARNLGYPDLGHIASALAVAAAARLDDPVARGKAMFVFARSDGSDWARAAQRAVREIERLQPHVRDDRPESIHVLGMLMLNAAMATAASLKADTARGWLSEAADLARRVDDDIDRNWESFSATNVRIWRVKIGVELGESGRRVRELGSGVDLTRLATYPARKANFLTETGRGLAREKSTREEAVRWLLQAEKAGPQRFRNNARVRETLAVMLEQARSSAGGRELRGLAARVGVPH